ncbi:hypothetical protein K435DRAFT_800755 [Dendrothele bispora CBS 962.96]|uniref:Uncharacterized protein n=1 Tax=Dendrothele bispora (strain CBS 962.96) TaxID=1314807 RepID=A0A4S8LRE6_DENBC|nr:hypothetical protein K435DRAFT_800755 [Dendrothele bispora CBS 962.96]
MFSLHASADFNVSFNKQSPELIANTCRKVAHDNPITSHRHDSPQPDITPSYMNFVIKNKRKIYKESFDQGPVLNDVDKKTSTVQGMTRVLTWPQLKMGLCIQVLINWYSDASLHLVSNNPNDMYR